MGEMRAEATTLWDRLNLENLAVWEDLMDGSGHTIRGSVVKAVMGRLMVYAREDGAAWPSIAELALRVNGRDRKTGKPIGTRTISRALQALSLAGVIELRRQTRRASGGGPRVLVIDWNAIAARVEEADRDKLHPIWRHVPPLVASTTGGSRNAPGAHRGPGVFYGDGEGDGGAGAPPEGAAGAPPEGAAGAPPEGARTSNELEMNQQQEASELRDAGEVSPATPRGSSEQDGDAAAGDSLREGGEAHAWESVGREGGREGEQDPGVHTPGLQEPESESDAVRGVERHLAVRGIAGAKRALLLGFAREGLLDAATVKREITKADRMRKGSGALIENLEAIARGKLVLRREAVDAASMADARENDRLTRFARKRVELVRLLVELTERSVRSMPGAVGDEALVLAMSPAGMELRVIARDYRLRVDEVEALWREVWERVSGDPQSRRLQPTGSEVE